LLKDSLRMQNRLNYSARINNLLSKLSNSNAPLVSVWTTRGLKAKIAKEE